MEVKREKHYKLKTETKQQRSTTLWHSSFEQTSYWVSESWLYYKMFRHLSVPICEAVKIKTDRPKTLGTNT